MPGLPTKFQRFTRKGDLPDPVPDLELVHPECLSHLAAGESVLVRRTGLGWSSDTVKSATRAAVSLESGTFVQTRLDVLRQKPAPKPFRVFVV